MSMVGPRPEVLDKAAELTGPYARIMELRPGITDWSSIWDSDEGGVLAGAPDPDAAYEAIIRPTKLKLQLYYCDTRSFFGDVKLIFYTAWKLVKKDWVPAELRGYPTFAELRAEVEKLVVTQNQSQQPQDQTT